MIRRLAAAATALLLAGCISAPPSSIRIPTAATISAGCRPRGTFGGRWLITFNRAGYFRYAEVNAAPTAWRWHAVGSFEALELGAVLSWHVEEYVAGQPPLVASRTITTIPALECGVYR